MNDYTVTAGAFAITATCLWTKTRKSEVRYVRWQWRKPHWPLLRLLAVFLGLHVVFGLLGIRTALGFLFVGILAMAALTVEFSGLWAVPVAAVGLVLYEWVFWFPSRRQLILRNPRPARTKGDDHLIGLDGVAVSDLKPTGTILIRGVEHTARSDGGFIAKGEKVVIEAAGDFELKVKKANG